LVFLCIWTKLASAERIACARVFVEIAANKNLPKSVHLQLEDGTLAQLDIECEWLPPACHKCSTSGHLDVHCPTKAVWMAKESVVANVEKEKNM